MTTLLMTYAKSTKGTHVYEAKPTGAAPAITSVYIQKWAIVGEPPREIEVTFKEAGK